MIYVKTFSKLFIIFLFLSFYSNLFSQTDSLAGYWKFDSASGNVAFDSSGNENDGEIFGADWTTGRVGNALLFQDSLNSVDYVEIPTGPSLAQIDSQITIACWVRIINRDEDWTTIIQRSAERDTNQWFDFQIYARAKDTPSRTSPAFRIDFNENGQLDPGESVHVDTSFVEGEWYYITCTYDGLQMKFYIDGILRDSVESIGGRIPNSNNNIWIAANETWSNEFFFGTIDELRIYTVALAQDEIVKIMQDTVVTDIKADYSFKPDGYELYQNYPNPFNPSTKIKYALSNQTFVTLKVFNLLGKEITTLVNENQNAGVYTVDFDGSNLPNGVYFYKLSTQGYSETKKLILLK